jgi:predicted enzyme related to lactoylglutathione lyase
MARVTGIGGIFLKSGDRPRLIDWYRDHLGIPVGPYGARFDWRPVEDPEAEGHTVWGVFDSETTYLDPSDAPFMVNYRVDDLDGMLAQLKAAGAQVIDRIEEYEYGRFGWAMDPDGNKIELWEPTDVAPANE